MLGPLLTFYTPQVCCLLLALIYPTYKTVQTIESRDAHATCQWLTYWVLFGLMTGIEAVLGFLLRWIPLYYIGKCVLTLWLVAPHTEGACWLWNKARPMLLEHAPQLLNKPWAGRPSHKRTASPFSKSSEDGSNRSPGGAHSKSQ